MNLGAEPKKIAVLSVLAVVGGYVFYANVLAGPEETRKTPAAALPSVANLPAGAARPPAGPNVKRAKVPVRGAASQEFKPTLKPRPEDRPDYATVDPTLRLDLLAKVQSVEPQGGSRSLFQFAPAPPPPPPPTTPGTPTIKPGAIRAWVEPPPGPAPPVVPPPPPPPPPITLKFYGYSAPKASGQKRAFFLDGDEIFVAAEGELVKKRYRVVQIGVNSVIMEDTEFKNNRQTLVLQQEQAG